MDGTFIAVIDKGWTQWAQGRTFSYIFGYVFFKFCIKLIFADRTTWSIILQFDTIFCSFFSIGKVNLTLANIFLI